MLNKITNYLPSFPTFKLATPKQMLNNVTKIALPAIALVAIATQMTKVEAGPLAYAACVAECMALTLGGFLPLCLAGCGPILMAPTP